MNFEEIEYQIRLFKSDGKKIFATSSFQGQSIVLLHLLNTIDSGIPIYFINTGFLFPETIIYKDTISNLLDLYIIEVRPTVPKNLQKDSSGNLLYTSDPDFCCHINKVQPLDSILAENDIWISGLRANQNENRKNLKTFEKAPHNVQRFHPLLDWTDKMIFDYSKKYNLPSHPLENSGYLSIGCEPCTRKSEYDSRSGRWFGLTKNECGLHTDLIIK
ncbi:MAG: phosphoadenosine phosphosulfate reductase [Bacteroidetes bacterium GWA2_30_7]|nr:MAG: phosphoadenosine phosphosulfate reductase [Bacteroidetes bacterium GWA2_30_7]